MANCNNLFQRYNSVIKLSDDKRTVLITARESIRKRIKEGFAKLPEQDRSTHELDFQSQGSFVMDTIIRPENDDFDLDDGVYFQGSIKREQRAKPNIFHQLIIRSIDKNNGIEDIEDKSTCVRVKYINKNNGNTLGFHIDIPIYYADNFYNPDLADTKRDWTISNPVEFIAWFEEKAKSKFEKAFLLESHKYSEQYEKWLSDIRKEDSQLRRIVRYMKAWADLKKKEMPAGIIMTILAAENYVMNERDDVAFRDTLINIKKYLDANNCQCPRPTTPAGEDLFAEKTDEEKKYFLNALYVLINSANEAIELANQKEACSIWQKHLGNRFPCHLAKDEVYGAKTFHKPAIIGDTAKSA
jgi:hypothetical protein